MVNRLSKAKSSDNHHPQKSTRGQHPMPVFLRIGCTILFLVVISIFLTWFVLWQTNLRDTEAAWEFLQANPVLISYNFLLLFALLTTLTALTWRPFLSTGVFFAFCSIITFINAQKFHMRAAPLVPEDFLMTDQAGNISQFVDSGELMRLIFGVVFVVIGSGLVEFYIRKLVGRKLKPLPWWDRTALVPRLTFTLSSLALLVAITAPIIHRQNFEWTGVEKFTAWSQTENYEANGFVVGFLYNLGTTDIDPPVNYQETTIHKIADKYRAIKVADKDRLDWDEQVDNVIIILAETFYEPALLTKYYNHAGGDVTPNLHAIFQKYPSGYMYSPEYGGGTANVEFEVQTGLSNYWAMTVPYVNIVPKLNNLISAASHGKNYDFSSTGLHSYDGTMYKRNLAYNVMGYGGFIDESEMRHTEREGKSDVYNDRAIYLEILDLLHENDQPMVISAITMQNHSPYAQAEYETFDFPVYTRDEGWWSIQSSFQSLHTSDQYLGEFIDALDQLDERTVVLWFGDHAMGLLDRYINSEDKLERDIAHLTPYFIYANFDIESPYSVKETAKLNAEQGFNFNNIKYIRGVDLPTTSPNCLLNTMYNTLNISKPSLFYLVDTVCAEAPILTHVFEDTNYTIESTPALKEYELVNYDILHGKHYWDGS